MSLDNNFRIPSAVNVVMNHYKDYTTFEDVILAKCVVCNKTLEVKDDPLNKFDLNKFDWDTWLKPFADFAFDHKHEKVTFINNNTTQSKTAININPGKILDVQDATETFMHVPLPEEPKIETSTYNQVIRVVEEYKGRKFRDV
jgi:hypothetical protein